MFEIASTKRKYDANKVIVLEQGTAPYVIRTSVNNGQKGYLNEDVQYLNPGNTLSFGQDTATMFYQEQPYFTGDKIKILTPILSGFKKKNAQFFITALNKAFACFSWGSSRFNVGTIGCQVITLPVSKDGEIDFEFINTLVEELEAERVSELEAERISKLRAYLTAANLKDFELTEEEKLAVGNSTQVSYETFKISEIFNLKKGKRLTKACQLPGYTPFIGATERNNGITGYIGQKPLFEDHAITVSYNGSVGQVFYQEHPFWASDDINVLFLKDHALNRELYGYLSACLYMAGKPFAYTFKWNKDRMSETTISLPIQTNIAGLPIIDPMKTYHSDGFIPDWNYMETHSRAIEKLVIKDVVEFADKKITAVKQIIGG